MAAAKKRYTGSTSRASNRNTPRAKPTPQKKKFDSEVKMYKKAVSSGSAKGLPFWRSAADIKKYGSSGKRKPVTRGQGRPKK